VIKLCGLDGTEQQKNKKKKQQHLQKLYPFLRCYTLHREHTFGIGERKKITRLLKCDQITVLPEIKSKI
jgi:hypothetical protein